LFLDIIESSISRNFTIRQYYGVDTKFQRRSHWGSEVGYLLCVVLKCIMGSIVYLWKV